VPDLRQNLLTTRSRASYPLYFSRRNEVCAHARSVLQFLAPAWFWERHRLHHMVRKAAGWT